MQQSCTSQAECDPKWLFEIGSSFTGLPRRSADRTPGRCGPSRSATSDSASIAACQSSASCSAFEQFSDVMCGVAERGSAQCAHFEIILRRLEGWRPEQVTWFLAIPYLPKLTR